MRRQGCIGWAWAILVIFAVGCGTASEGEPTATKSADEPSTPRIVGRWHGEVWVDEVQLAEVLPPEHIAALKSTKMDIAFDADGRMSLSGVNGDQPYHSEGRWQIVTEEGPKLVLKSIEDAGHEKEIQVRFDNDDAFSMSLPEPVTRMGAMQFRRLR